ncbi:MAG: type I-E CRISPR-associated protein Cse1/CasA [Rectinemataceae bacterium]
MNIAFDPWIPVVTMEGKSRLASLNEVFSDGEHFSDLAVRPHERVSLMRLFLCVAYAALNGPKDYAEWCKLPNVLGKAASKYLEDWKDSFELFHPTKPWLQVAALDVLSTENDYENDEDKGWSPLRSICYTKARGINPTLFDHSANSSGLEEYREEEIVLNLISFQNFFVAGGKASSRLWSKNKMINPANPKGGPCSGKSILFAFIRNKNLIETIISNLNSYDDLKIIYGNQRNSIGRPIWEYPITNPIDESAIQNATKTHLGRLVPQTRILRLNEDRKRVLLGAGFLYPKFQDDKNPFAPDIFATVRANKNDKIELVSVRPDKAIWRELHSISIYRSADSTNARGPLCLKNVPDNEYCDLVIDAMVTNPKLAAEIVGLVESVFVIPPRMRKEEGNNSYMDEVKKAESIASKLGWAIEGYREEIDGGWKGRLESAGAGKGELKAKLRFAGSNYYWTSVEKNLSLLMAHIKAIGTDEAMPTQEVWRKMLFSTACEAYKTACGQETPRQIKAFAKGWQRLTSTKEEVDNGKENIKEDEE